MPFSYTGDQFHEAGSLTQIDRFSGPYKPEYRVALRPPSLCAYQLGLVMAACGLTKVSLTDKDVAVLQEALKQGVIPASDVAGVRAFLQKRANGRRKK